MIKFAISTVFFIIIFLLLTSLWGFYISVRPPKIVSTFTPKDLSLDYEEVIFDTNDGVTLSGWFIPSKETGAKTIILLMSKYRYLGIRKQQSFLLALRPIIAARAMPAVLPIFLIASQLKRRFIIGCILTVKL